MPVTLLNLQPKILILVKSLVCPKILSGSLLYAVMYHALTCKPKRLGTQAVAVAIISHPLTVL